MNHNENEIKREKEEGKINKSEVIGLHATEVNIYILVSAISLNWSR